MFFSFFSIGFRACETNIRPLFVHCFLEQASRGPFCIGPLYYGVQSHALAYDAVYRPGPLEGSSAGCSYLPSAVRGDDLSGACEMLHHEFSLPELILAYSRCAAVWNSGVSLLRDGLRHCDDRMELGNALICGMCWRSTANAYRLMRCAGTGVRRRCRNSSIL